jgi:hypothetical protein
VCWSVAPFLILTIALLAKFLIELRLKLALDVGLADKIAGPPLVESDAESVISLRGGGAGGAGYLTSAATA